MKLIVGLGNPGKEYLKTRHNVGFMAIDKIAQKLNIEIKEQKFDGLYHKLTYNNSIIILLKPQKYMNLSGEVIKKYVDYFKINIDDILIISDDMDLDIGKIKLKYKGSSGGHNGLKNIEANLGTNEYKRLKIGISRNKLYDTKDYVLGRFCLEELIKIDESIAIMPFIFEDFINNSFDKVMSKYN